MEKYIEPAIDVCLVFSLLFFIMQIFSLFCYVEPMFDLKSDFDLCIHIEKYIEPAIDVCLVLSLLFFIIQIFSLFCCVEPMFDLIA